MSGKTKKIVGKGTKGETAMKGKAEKEVTKESGKKISQKPLPTESESPKPLPVVDYVDIKLPESSFSLEEAVHQYENGLLKDYLDCKQYISAYFYPLSNGDHGFYDAYSRKIEIMTKEQLNSVYLNRLPKVISKWYHTASLKICYHGFHVQAGLVYDKAGRRYLNSFPGFKFKERREPTVEERKGIDLLWSHVNKILCSGNETVYTFVRKWFSHVATGKKMKIALFIKSLQGAGKGTFTEFFFKEVMGLNLVFMASDPNCVLGRFNGQLKGKLMLVLEEMRALSTNEWTAVNDKLKNLITDSTTNFEDKYSKAVTEENHLSLIIQSNNDCIKLPHDDRRYLVLDVSDEKIGDIAYFDKIYKYTQYTPGFAEAFYWDCVAFAEEHQDWQEYKDILNVVTETKRDIIIKHMDSLYKYIKTEYLLKNKGLDVFLKTLTEEYNEKNTKSSRDAREVGKLLKQIGVVGKASTGNKLRFKLTYEELYEIFKKKNFIDDKDEKDEDITDEVDVSEISNAVNYSKKTISEEKDAIIQKYKKQLEKLSKENEQLRRKIQMIENKKEDKVVKVKKISTTMSKDREQLKLIFE